MSKYEIQPIQPAKYIGEKVRKATQRRMTEIKTLMPIRRGKNERWINGAVHRTA